MGHVLILMGGNMAKTNRRNILIFNKFTALFIFAVLFFSLTSCGNDSSSSQNEKRYSLRHVVDGDTIEVSTLKRVRYIGIDTPETRKKENGEWIFRPERYAVEAKKRNEELVSGKMLEVEFDEEKKDRYGRYLAYVYADGEMINLQLLKEGLATVYTFPPNLRYYKEMVKCQREAFDGKMGLWGTVKTIKVSEIGEYYGTFCQVRGSVSGVEMSFGKILLYLVSGETGRLRLVIYLRNLSLFQAEGINPLKDYEGRNIEVFGKVRDKGDFAEIMVDNPFQIKVLEG